MIHWLIQHAETHPDLALGVPPADLLSAQEHAVFDALKTAKRRHDWLLGRWTAKHLVQQVLWQQGDDVLLSAVSVLAAPDGAPQLDNQQLPALDRMSISISHSQQTGFCAAVTQTAWPLGADIERIEPRSPGFVAGYFTEEEQARVAQTAPLLRPMLATAVWSAKESALKAIRQGLRLDTRCVACLLAPVAVPPLDWVPFEIEWDARYLGSLAGTTMPTLTGWWRTQGDFVLTLAARAI